VELSQELFTMEHTLWVFGWAHTGNGRPDLALPMLERALAELDRHTMYAFTSIGWVRASEAHLALGNTQSALENAQQALDTARTTEDMTMAGVALRVLGRAEVAAGQLELAREHLAEALELFEGFGAPLEVAHILSYQAELAQAAGNPAAAKALLARSRDLFTDHDVPRAAQRVELRAAELCLA
jgi:tetratricopeptide (TPR) repeat protein